MNAQLKLPFPGPEKIIKRIRDHLDELIEWLQSKGYSIVKINSLDYYRGNIEYTDWEKLRYQFFGADPVKIEKELQAMLKATA
ncbi:hypothetical protein LCGC14_2695730 [marine sediment metagenome]|uniref:Uncharacterized protein n=1 Tax=marine sediment metagenome TaxID=412755 RepID=A0A0F8ZH46_9ZZZZ